MGRTKLYISLSLKDVFRLWSATQLQVIIVAGICLPILLLLGLKNGHVAELREELATSPTGRQIIFWSALTENLLSESVLAEIDETVNNSELIIPESQRVVFVTPVSSGHDSSESQDSSEPISLTLYSTLPGDPILAQFNADILFGGSLEMVLSKSVADDLKVEIGDTIPVQIKRQLGNDRETHQLTFVLRGLLSGEKKGRGSAVGYAHLDVMQMLEKYGSGAAISEWHIPAMEDLAAIDLYESMLLFCFRGEKTNLNENDLEFLKSRGLAVNEVSDAQLQTLYGSLNDSKIGDLVVYQLQRLDKTEEALTPIHDSPGLLVRNTEAKDDAIVRWNEPLVAKIEGREFLLVGLSLPVKRQTGGWIQPLLHDESRWFTYQQSSDDPFQIFLESGGGLNNLEAVNLELDGDTQIALTNRSRVKIPEAGDPSHDKAADDSSEKPRDQSSQETDTALVDPGGGSNASQETDSDERAEDSTVATESRQEHGTQLPVAVVPVNLLAYLKQYRAGLVDFDVQGKRFIAIPTELDYTKARLYTKTIDDVPDAVDILAGKNFAVLSESSRIAEIHEQDNSLQLLVWVVAFGVFLFGIVTVFSVMVDSTDRKKGTIGILRVMGTSRFGVFFIVLFRALTIGLLAAFVCSIVGFGLAHLLGANFSNVASLAWKPVISVILTGLDIGFVAVGAVLCAALGAVMPALKASALDPFEAIMQGQFN